MKKRIHFLVFSFFTCLTDIYAQNDTSNSTAKVYLIRGTGLQGCLTNFRVLINDSVYCKLANNRYSILDIKPGQYTFYVTTWDAPRKRIKQGLEMPLDAGKTYYLRLVIKVKFGEITNYFEEITGNSAKLLLAKYKLETNNNNLKD
jgi:hypothetical protein